MKKYVLMALLLCLVLCMPALAAAEDAKPMLDVVWVVDCTRSMPQNINKVMAQLANFASKLTDFDVQYGLVGFGDELNDVTPRESTVKIQWDGSNWTSDISVLRNSMASGDLPSYHGGDADETVTCGLYMAATRYNWRENAVHAIVLLANYNYKTQGTSLVTGKAIPSMQECLDACIERNISINLLNCYGATAYYNAVTQSGGVIASKSDGWPTAVGQLAQWIHDTPIVITQPEDLYLHDDDIVKLNAETLKGKVTWFEWVRMNKSGYPQGLLYYYTSDGIAWYNLHADSYMDGTEYYCIFSNSRKGVTGDTRSIETRHAILHVASEFAITGQPQDVTIEAGKTAAFTVVATGDDLTYQWQKNVNGTWTNLSGKTASTLSIPATMADDGSEYRCVIKDAISDKQPGGYTLTSDSAALTVVAAPAIATNPRDVTTEDGKTATFTVKATGDSITYQWQKQVDGGWTDLSGETGASLTVPASLENNGSLYRCQVTSGYGTAVASQPARLTVLAAPAIAAQPASIVVTEEEDASFTVTATGAGLKYQWQVNSFGEWTNCADGQQSTLTLSAVPLTNDGLQYRCLITSSYGTEIISDTATLTVLAKVEPPPTGDSFRPWLWAALLGASLLGLTMLRRRHA
ncbi:MAG: VWA domain-containing protein [bacterium]|nr:VWA domain-containing protein [bacterium]